MDFCPFCDTYRACYGKCEDSKKAMDESNWPIFKIDESKWPAFKENAMSILNTTRDEWLKMLRGRPNIVGLKCGVYYVAYERDEDGREFAFIKLALPEGVFVVTEDGQALSDSCFGNLAGIKIFLYYKEKSLAGRASLAASDSPGYCTIGSSAWMCVALDYIKKHASSVEEAVNSTNELHAIVARC